MPESLGTCDRHPSAQAHAIWVNHAVGVLTLCAHCDHVRELALTLAGWHAYKRDTVLAERH